MNRNTIAGTAALRSQWNGTITLSAYEEIILLANRATTLRGKKVSQGSIVEEAIHLLYMAEFPHGGVAPTMGQNDPIPPKEGLETPPPQENPNDAKRPHHGAV